MADDAPRDPRDDRPIAAAMIGLRTCRPTAPASGIGRPARAYARSPGFGRVTARICTGSAHDFDPSVLCERPDRDGASLATAGETSLRRILPHPPLTTGTTP